MQGQSRGSNAINGLMNVSIAEISVSLLILFTCPFFKNFRTPKIGMSHSYKLISAPRCDSFPKRRNWHCVVRKEAASLKYIARIYIVSFMQVARIFFRYPWSGSFDWSTVSILVLCSVSFGIFLFRYSVSKYKYLIRSGALWIPFLFIGFIFSNATPELKTHWMSQRGDFRCSKRA